MADVIVEVHERTRDDPFVVFPRRPLSQYRLEDASQEKRLEQFRLAEMREQIGLVYPVGRQDTVKCQAQDGIRLSHVLKRARTACVQCHQFVDELSIQRGPRPLDAVFAKELIRVAELFLKASVGLSLREIQVAQHRLQGDNGIQAGGASLHGNSSSSSPPTANVSHYRSIACRRDNR